MSDRFSNAPISKLLGLNVLPASAEDRELGRATVELFVDERLHNPMGRVHGGILSVIADAAMGIAFGRTLDEHQDFSTIDLNMHFMRPVRGQLVRAFGAVIQRGIRIGFVQCTLTDEQGREIAFGTCSCTILETL